MAGRVVWLLQRPFCVLRGYSRVRALEPLVKNCRHEPRRNLQSNFLAKTRSCFIGQDRRLSNPATGITAVTGRVRKGVLRDEDNLDTSETVVSNDEKPKRRLRKRKKEIDADGEIKTASETLKRKFKRTIERDTDAVSDNEKPSHHTLEQSDAGVETEVASGKLKRKSRKSKGLEAETNIPSDKEKAKKRSRKAVATDTTKEVESVKEEKPKKGRQKIKYKIEQAETPETSYPFEGTLITDTEQEENPREYSAADDEFVTPLISSSVRKIDTNKGRYYQITTAKGEVCFPSVTTVLKHTMPKDFFFRLHNWKKSMIKEHGVKGFEVINRETRQSGTNFHLVSYTCMVCM